MRLFFRFALALSLTLGVFTHAAEFHVLAGDIAPFSYVDAATGAEWGISIDILRAMQAEGGPTFHIESTAWSRAQSLTQQGGHWLIVPLTRTPAREAQYRWIAPLFSYQFVFVTTLAKPPSNLEEAKHLAIATLRNNAVSASLAGLGLDRVGLSDTEEISARRLHENQSQAWLVADLVAPFIYRRMGYDPAELQYSSFHVGSRWDVWLAASPDLTEADVKLLAGAVERLRAKGEIERIVARYR